MKFSKSSLISKSITLFFIVFIIWYFVNNQDALMDLKEIPMWAFMALIISKAIRLFVSGLFTKLTLNSFNKQITIRETNKLSLLSSLGNFFGPILGGASIRAVYLKNNYNFNYSKFIATLYAYYVVSFLTNSLIGIFVIAGIYIDRGSVFGILTIFTVFLSIFLLCLCSIMAPDKYVRKILNYKLIPNRIVNILNRVHDGWEIMRTNTKLLYKLFLLNIATLAISMFTSYIVFRLFVDDFNATSVLLYTILSTLALLVNFTPNAIGIKEGIYIFSASIMLLTPEQILQMSVVDRASTFVLLGGLYLISKIFDIFEVRYKKIENK